MTDATPPSMPEVPVETPPPAVESPAPAAEAPTVMSTLQAIKTGRIAPKNLGVTERRACIEYLVDEGYSVPEIAELMKISERTVTRDRNALKAGRSIKADPKLAGEMAGELMREADLCRTPLGFTVRSAPMPILRYPHGHVPSRYK